MIPFSYYESSAESITEAFGQIPDTAIVLGSGLGGVSDVLTDARSLDYARIPHFSRPTAVGHAGSISCGSLCGRRVMLMSGRLHCYEGYSMAEAAYYVRVLYLCGVKQLILTNAAGAVNTDFKPGDIMTITDHIKLCAESPLTGGYDKRFGPMFADMSQVYDAGLRQAAQAAAAAAGIPLKSGVYMYFSGPQYETPAEIRAARALGADAVGMSTVPESVTAAACGMKVLALSVITNMAAGITQDRLDGDDVAEKGSLAAKKVGMIISEMMKS